MPVRIYEISKKLGLESKQVLAKARELGIPAAKVASSTLDKITAEYLEEELRKTFPAATPESVAPPAETAPAQTPEALAPPAPGEAEPSATSAMTPVAAAPAALPAAPAESSTAVIDGIIVTSLAAPPPITVIKPAPPPPPPPAARTPPPTPAAEVSPPVTGSAVEAAPAPALPAAPAQPPPPPPKPRIGEIVGRINLDGKAIRTPPAGRGAALKTPPQRATPPGVATAKTAKPPEPPKTLGAPSTKTATTTFEPPKPTPPARREISLPADAPVILIKPPIVVRDLAEKLNQKPFKIIADLMELGVFARVNDPLDDAQAQQICAKYGYRLEVEKRRPGAGQVHRPLKPPKPSDLDKEEKPEDQVPRPPVITIMGHVDHGKTTLLDVIRKSNVAAGEAGGITQHIGAYTISIPHPDRKNELAQITFLDTPGHEAFSAMRARGANVTDIVVLVVAANDGVMPQTIEALNHARAANVPIVVAVNKIDHPNAHPMRVRQQLQAHGLLPDDMGGDTIYVDVSALTKHGVDKLLEMLLFQAAMLDLKANPNRPAWGYIIESGIEPGGPTATVLVRRGTLRVGDIVLANQYYGKVRALINEDGKRLKEAGPSVAVKVLGLNGVPEAGTEFSVVEDERTARTLAEQRAEQARQTGKEDRQRVTLENLFDTLAASESKVLKVVVKADTQGSVEAIVSALNQIQSDKVSLQIIHHAVGSISENDVLLASASHAIILGFHTRVDSTAAETAKREGVQIKLYTVIYELIDQVKDAMAGLLAPMLREVVLGTAEVRQIFQLSKGTPVAGCFVTNGRIGRGKVRVRRRGEVIFEGVVQSLRRFQDEVNEVRAGLECGIRLQGFGDFAPGDLIETYTFEKVAQKL